MEKIIISKLDESTLMHSDVIWDYYQREWQFSTISYNDIYINIPILKEASHTIEGQKYPWKQYIEGFLSEYNKPLPKDIDLTLHLSHVQPNPPLPVAPAGFSNSNAINYGVTMARAFKVWEFIAERLPDFEKIFQGGEYNKWDKLFNNLIDKKIKDVSLADFKEVMHHKRRPNGKGQILWIGEKSEAMFFQQKYDFSVKQLNECFKSYKGGVFHTHNRTFTSPESADPEFLKLLT
jgi:hypothetical protein